MDRHPIPAPCLLMKHKKQKQSISKFWTAAKRELYLKHYRNSQKPKAQKKATIPTAAAPSPTHNDPAPQPPDLAVSSFQVRVPEGHSTIAHCFNIGNHPIG